MERVPGGLQLDRNIAPLVASICRQLDGLPLAIELAANRVGEFTVHELESRLDHRFELLDSRREVVFARHRTLLIALQWSNELLPPTERVILRRLSVFAGPFDADDACAVCTLDGLVLGDVANLLSKLAGKSLLVRTVAGPHTRYYLYESVRHFANQALTAVGEEEIALAAHARWCCLLASRADLDGPGQADAFLRLSASDGDMRAALAWSLNNNRELAVDLAPSLARYWITQGRLTEGRMWLAKVLADDSSRPAARAKALWGMALIACLLGDFVAVGPTTQEALSLARRSGDSQVIARVLSLIGVLRIFINPPGALDVLQEAALLSRRVGELRTLVSSLGMLGFARSLCGDLVGATKVLEESVSLGRSIGDDQSLAISLVGLGHVLQHQGELARAQCLLDEGLVVGRRVNDPLWMALALAFLAELALIEGDGTKAGELAQDAVTLARGAGSAPVVGLCLGIEAAIELEAGQPAVALAHSQEALSLCGGGERAGVFVRALVGLGRARMDLGDPGADNLELEQAYLIAESSENLIATAEALYWLGRLAGSHGDYEGALGLHLKALLMRSKARQLTCVPASLMAVSALLARAGDTKKAARLLGAAESLRATIGLTPTSGHRTDYEASLLFLEETMDAAGRTVAFDAGAALGVDSAVAYACRGREGRGKRSAWGWISLTSTEWQVAELTAEHLTNAEIGGRLFMSPRTVQTHLRNIFRKVDLRSRRELAREITRRRQLGVDQTGAMAHLRDGTSD